MKTAKVNVKYTPGRGQKHAIIALAKAMARRAAKQDYEGQKAA